MKIRVVEIREVEVDIKNAKTYSEAEEKAIKAIKNGEVILQHVGYSSFIK